MTTVFQRQLSMPSYSYNLVGMNGFGSRLQLARKKSGLSQSIVASHIGMDKTNLSRLENGRSGVPTIDTVKKISTVPGLGVDLQTLLEWRRQEEMQVNAIEASTPNAEILTPTNKIIKLPLYDMPVPAGCPNLVDNPQVDEWLEFPEEDIKNPKNTFCVRVSGHSMDPELRDGDIIVLDSTLEAKNGDIVLAQVNQEVTVKWFKKSKGKIFLVPENPKFKTIEIQPEDEVHICGVMIEMRRRRK